MTSSGRAGQFGPAGAGLVHGDGAGGRGKCCPRGQVRNLPGTGAADGSAPGVGTARSCRRSREGSWRGALYQSHIRFELFPEVGPYRRCRVQSQNHTGCWFELGESFFRNAYALAKGISPYTNVSLYLDCHCEKRSDEAIELDHHGALRAPAIEHLPFVIAKEPKRLRQSTRPDGLPRSASLARNDNRGVHKPHVRLNRSPLIFRPNCL